jgi:hypothetical protein
MFVSSDLLSMPEITAPRTIPPNPLRWQPNPDPNSIHVPGLDTNAPVLDQIEQIEQLITIKLQASSVLSPKVRSCSTLTWANRI